MSSFSPTDPRARRDLGQRLLRSMERDAPPPGAKAATLNALGVSTIATLCAATPATSAASGMVGGVAATVGKASAIFGSGLLKTAFMGTVIGAALGTSAIGASVAFRHGSSPPSTVASPSAAARRGARPTAATTSMQVARESALTLPDVQHVDHEANQAPPRQARPDPSTTVLRERNVENPRSADAPIVNTAKQPKLEADLGLVPATTVPATTVPALPRETAQIARVRAALREGDLTRALAGLERYDSDFSSGVLRPEAFMLRIEAWVQAGSMARARQAAEHFIATYPSSPHLPRIRKLVGL